MKKYLSYRRGEVRTEKEIKDLLEKAVTDYPDHVWSDPVTRKVWKEALEWVLEGKKHKPIEAGNSYGMEYRCSNCDFPENETLLWSDKYCMNCGCELDWSEWEEKK
jgi:hypothetical protein